MVADDQSFLVAGPLPRRFLLSKQNGVAQGSCSLVYHWMPADCRQIWGPKKSQSSTTLSIRLSEGVQNGVNSFVLCVLLWYIERKISRLSVD